LAKKRVFLINGDTIFGKRRDPANKVIKRDPKTNSGNYPTTKGESFCAEYFRWDFLGFFVESTGTGYSRSATGAGGKEKETKGDV